jgi:hypothetical protein
MARFCATSGPLWPVASAISALAHRMPAAALCDRCSGFGADLLVGWLDPKDASVGFCGSLYATVDGFDRVRFCPHNGLKSDIEPCLKSATALNRCAIARCAGSPTASTVAAVKIVDSAPVALS